MPMFNANNFGERVRVVLARRRIGMREAAKELRVSLATVSRVANGNAPDVENYLRIQRWLAKHERNRP